MDKRQALALLAHGEIEIRLQGARYFERHAKPEDEPMLREALSKEDVSWIRLSLGRALQRVHIGEARQRIAKKLRSTGPEIVAPDRTRIADVTRSLLHEIEPILGAIKVFAESEILDYPNSRVARHLSRLDALLDGIGNLSRAAGDASLSDCDVAQLVDQVCEGEEGQPGVRFDFDGPRSLLARADPALVEIVLRNGVRNAIESYPPDAAERPVVITWGENPEEIWIQVIDAGIGPPSQGDKVWEIGSTTKQGHFGLGLSITRQAIESMNGTIALRANPSGGACLDVRWPKFTRTSG